MLIRVTNSAIFDWTSLVQQHLEFLMNFASLEYIGCFDKFKSSRTDDSSTQFFGGTVLRVDVTKSSNTVVSNTLKHSPKRKNI